MTLKQIARWSSGHGARRQSRIGAGPRLFPGETRDQLLNRVNGYKWVHTIDLGDGVKTPGLWGAHNPQLFEAINDIDFQGKKVLDIGCWDGLFSFEAEKRGASEVYATDSISQRDFMDHQTFRLAHAILESKAHYHPHLSVYDVEKLGIRDFDVVIYCGIYYHLKDPLRALTALRRVMKPGAVILVEGAILPDPGCFAKYFYRETFCGDNSNWWVPTKQCAREWVECSFFEIQKDYPIWGHEPNFRYPILAKAVVRSDSLYSRPDEELAEYDLTERGTY